MTTTDITIDTGTDELLLHHPRPRRHHHAEPAGSAQRDVGPSDPGLALHDQDLSEYPQVGALLFTGAGSAFCAGGDVKGMGARRARKKLEMSMTRRSRICRNGSGF